jgi:ADP-heptose:LPS heptosyltransferase
MTGHAEAELVFRFAPLLGLNSATPPPPRVVPAEDAVRRVRAALEPSAGGPLLGIHISARKPSQRWPVERFAQLMRALHGLYGARFLLFWAPGAATDAKHPGDDEKAALLREATRDLPVTPWQTSELRDLIAGIAVCDAMILGDGGAMHLAAGLGKPIVCLFGQSDAQRWRPWRVPYRLLQPDSRSVADITIEQVLTTYNSLMQSCQAPARLSCPVQEGPVSPLPDATR